MTSLNLLKKDVLHDQVKGLGRAPLKLKAFGLKRKTILLINNLVKFCGIATRSPPYIIQNINKGEFL